MATRLKTVSVLWIVALATIAVGSTVVGQGQPAAAPPPQAGHPTGKLIIWGDLASFDNPPTAPTHCVLANRFKRGQRVGIRMTAIDGGTGEVENTAVMTAHLTYAGTTIDVPMRWRGVGGFPAAEYPRQPSEQWTGAWEVPADAPIGTLEYTVTAKDRFGREATFKPFPNHLTQFTIIE